MHIFTVVVVVAFKDAFIIVEVVLITRWIVQYFHLFSKSLKEAKRYLSINFQLTLITCKSVLVLLNEFADDLFGMICRGLTRTKGKVWATIG